jgi:predicted lipid-binding transport protein (Tim44 family)
MATEHEFRLRDAQPHGWRRWGGSVARSIYAGVVVGMLAGFLTLMIALFGMIAARLFLQRFSLDITIVYREVAPAIAVFVAILVFLGNIVWERTHPAPART